MVLCLGTLALLLGAPPSAGTGVLRGAQRLLGVPANEPTLAISKKGTLFYPFGVPGQVGVLRSTDGGARWADVTPEAAPGAAAEVGDPFVLSDPLTGRVFRAGYAKANEGACINLMWTDDEGTRWTHQPRTCGLVGVHDHESLATGRPRTPLPMVGYPNVVYLCVNSLHTACSSSRNGGQTFGPLVPVYPAADPSYGLCGGLNAPVVTDSKGRVFVPRTWCGRPTIAVSEDDGLTWTRRQIPTTRLPAVPAPLVSVAGQDVPYIDGQDVMLTVDAADNLHAGWVARDGFAYVTSSRDQGRSWTPTWRVAVPSVTAVGHKLLTLEGGAAGRLVVAFIGSDHRGGMNNRTAAQWKGASWHLYLAVTDNAFAARPLIQSTRVNPSSDPVGRDDCGLGRCLPCDVGCAGMYDYIDVDIDRHGRPWVAFVDVCQATCRRTGKMDKGIASVAYLSQGPSLLNGRRLSALR